MSAAGAIPKPAARAGRLSGALPSPTSSPKSIPKAIPKVGRGPVPEPLAARLALVALSALAHEGRLAVVRVLCRVGPGGAASGALARALCVAPNTLSAQLAVLTRAGLIRRRPAGRQVIYAAEPEAMAAVVLWLLTDGCAGDRRVAAAVLSGLEPVSGPVPGPVPELDP